MSKREERQVFDMAKQDIPFLKDLELVKHDDRPDFVLKDMDTYAEHREGKINILFNMQANQPKYDVSATKTMLKNERRKLDREERKHFDKVTKDFCK